jgi:FkbM family methyltransferase
MLSRSQQVWFKFSNFCIRSGLGRFLALLWHKLMPCFPIRRKVFGLQIYFDSRDHPCAWYATRNILEQSENIPKTLGQFRGRFWDVGSNVGFYSLWMASRGNPVVAFDISPKAISYVLKSAAKNGLKNIIGVPRAFSTESFRYQTPQTAVGGNQLKIAAGADAATAITYLEAAEKYGVPAVIKMDIEGHEENFLRSDEFKQWIIRNKIAIFMELHSDDFWQLLWPEVRQVKLKEKIVLLNAPENIVIDNA